jgi:hypothetical protein
MPLEFHSNDNAREGRPGIWIFQGSSVVLLVAGVAAFVALFRIFAAAGFDWPFSLGLSLIPLMALAAYVHLMVNGKAPSYATDVLLFVLWRVKVRTYLAGALDRPPQFWVKGPRPCHRGEFQGDTF